MLIECSTRPDCKYGSDHIPIQTKIDVSIVREEPELSYNFRKADWEQFDEKLKESLEKWEHRERYETQEEMEEEVDQLTSIIQDTIALCIPKNKHTPNSKRWWNGRIESMK